MNTINTAALAIAFGALTALAATSALACGGNACGNVTDYVYGGGYVEGGGQGAAQAGNTYAGGNVIQRESFADSLSGFDGSFRYGVDACGDCEADTNATNGFGFTANRAGSFIVTDGHSASAGSQVGGVAAGEGAAWSWRPSSGN